MAALVVCALCALVYVKPQEFMPALSGLPLLYIAFGTAIVAATLDIVWRRIRLAPAPQLPFLAAFFVWGLLTTVVKRPAAVPDQATALAILAGIVLSVSIGAASRFGLRLFTITFVACAGLATVVAIIQNYGPLGCFLGEPGDWAGKKEMVFDGRPCESIIDCRKAAPIPDGNYRCEKVGPLGTSSLAGRVRYRGSLGDPNELSLAISVAVPFVLAFADTGLRRRAKGPAKSAVPERKLVRLPALISDRLLSRITAALRALPVVAAIGAVGFTVVLSRSRGGLIVFMTVLGMHFVRKAGPWGLVAGCLVAPPLLLLGGRRGEDAASSSDQRAELLREAFQFIRSTKGIGVGVGQFVDNSSIGLTAHNAYMLAASEAGIVGLFLFGFALYLSIKVPFALWFGDYHLAPATRSFASALAVSLTSASIGIFFLSWTYKDVLYMLLGASAALYSVAKTQDSRVSVRLSLKEAMCVGGGITAVLGALYVAMRVHR